MVPEGEHIKDYLKSWSKFDVNNPPGHSDQLVYDGRTYKIAQVDKRTVLGGYKKFVFREAD